MSVWTFYYLNLTACKQQNSLSFLSVRLGSIPELPAETCQEIKLNELGQANSGKYWLSTIKTGTSVLAYCEMETEGKLRCTVEHYKH